MRMSNSRKAALILLIAIFICAMYYLNTTVFSQVPNVLEFHYQNPNIERMLPDELTKVNSTDPVVISKSTFKKETASTLSGDSVSVTAIYTDKYYKELYPINMLNGNFLIAKNSVVISDMLAKQLFYTADAVGYELRVGEEMYKITGIYKADTTFMAECSGPARIFLPIPTEMGVDMVSFDGTRSAGYYRSVFPKGIAYKMSGYMDVNILWEANIIKLLNLFLLLIFGILTLLKLLHKCYINFKRFYATMQTHLDVSYPKTALFHSIRPLLMFLLAVLLSLSVIVICMIAVAKPLSLPIDIVTNNIFDFAGYYHIITAKFAMPNTFIAPYGAYYLNYSHAAIILYLFATAVFLIVSTLIYKQKSK